MNQPRECPIDAGEESPQILTLAESLAFDLERCRESILAARQRGVPLPHMVRTVVVRSERLLSQACHLLAPDCHHPSFDQARLGHVVGTDCPACAAMREGERA